MTIKQLPQYFVWLVFLWACSDNNPTQSVKKPEKEAVEVPDFNADSAYLYIQQQVDFGPRFISSKGWQQCGDFLVKKLKDSYISKNPTFHTLNGLYLFNFWYVVTK